MNPDGADPFARFVEAQEPVHQRVVEELRAGAKRSHWMWFVFPQLAGLGMSAMSQRFALASVAQAAAYLAHPVLGPRLLECTSIIVGLPGSDAHAIFGSPDDAKLRSCMTLFAEAAPHEPLFQQALQKFWAGARDARTLDLLAREAHKFW